MEIKGSNSNFSSIQQSQTTASTAQLKNGQILNGIVTDISNNKVLIDIISPNLNIKFEADLNQKIHLGQKLLLQVTELTTPISIKLIENKLNSEPLLKNVLSSALKQILPKATSFNQLLSNLHYLSIPNPKLNNIYPQEILDLSRAVFQKFSSLKEIATSTGLRTALNKTGVYLEQQLLQANTISNKFTSQDVRITLLRLSEAIKSNLIIDNDDTHSSNIINKNPTNFKQLDSYNKVIIKNSPYSTQQAAFRANQHLNINNQKRLHSTIHNTVNRKLALSELSSNIDNSLAKLQYNQLQHFMSDEQSKSIWFFDLPIRREDGSDVLHFKFTKGKKPNTSKNEHEYSAILTFNLEQLGNLNIIISLKDQKISATIWATQKETYQLYNKYLPELYLQFKHSGINISSILVNNGELNQQDNILIKNILDEQA